MPQLRMTPASWFALSEGTMPSSSAYAGLVIANTGLPTGSGMTEGFKAWLEFSQSVPEMPIGMIVNMGTGRDLTPEEVAAYDAPFPDETYKEGARQFPPWCR